MNKNIKNAKDLSQEICKDIAPKVDEIIFDTTIIGSGIINLTLKKSYIENNINHIANNDSPLLIKTSKPKCIIIDYSSPNIAKQMHVGHLRSTIIGDILGNIFELKGNKLTRINHIGDWGTQFGMLIASIQVNNVNLDNCDIDVLHTCYKESKIIFDDDIEFNKLAHNKVVSLQSEDEECINIWKKICSISHESYNDIYNKLEISKNLIVCGESYYNDVLPILVKELDELIILKEEDGTKMLFTDENNKKIPPLIVRKSDGGYGYDSTDLAAIKHRINNLHADKIIYVTDSGQSDHFKLIFDAAKLMKLNENVELVHVGFGLILNKKGKKIKSR